MQQLASLWKLRQHNRLRTAAKPPFTPGNGSLALGYVSSCGKCQKTSKCAASCCESPVHRATFDDIEVQRERARM